MPAAVTVRADGRPEVLLDGQQLDPALLGVLPDLVDARGERLVAARRFEPAGELTRR